MDFLEGVAAGVVGVFVLKFVWILIHKGASAAVAWLKKEASHVAAVPSDVEALKARLAALEAATKTSITTAVPAAPTPVSVAK